MGSSTSKASLKAASLSATNTARKYPTRTPARSAIPKPQPAVAKAVNPAVYPKPSISEERSPAAEVERDAQDPDLALNARLQSLGPVQPNPTQSNSSTFNRVRPLKHSRDQVSSANTRTPKSSPLNSSTPNNDPSLSSHQFIPSASNPQQSIFPVTDQGNGRGGAGRQNPAVSLLTARFRLAEEAEREFGKIGKEGAEGRQFLDVVTLRQVLILRDERGVEAGEIERQLGLRRGAVGRLGRKGVVGVSS